MYMLVRNPLFNYVEINSFVSTEVTTAPAAATNAGPIALSEELNSEREV